MIYEQSCQMCSGDLVLVQEMHGVVFWCISCGCRTESAEAISLLTKLEAG